MLLQNEAAGVGATPTSQTEANYSTRPFPVCLKNPYCIFSSIRLYKQPMNDAQVEEIKRHFGVVAEALRSDIRQIAEGHSGIRHELQEIRDEFRDEFKEMRALLRLSFSQLDQRIRTLETDISTLKSRMDRIETHPV